MSFMTDVELYLLTRSYKITRNHHEMFLSGVGDKLKIKQKLFTDGGEITDDCFTTNQ